MKELALCGGITSVSCKVVNNGEIEGVMFLRREDLGEPRSWRGACSASYRKQLLQKMAATRLRKTFQYPVDNSDDDDTPKDLDEEGYCS